MRFVLVGPSAPLRGGIAIDNDALARALVVARHEVEQLSFRRLYPGLFRPFLARGKGFRVRFCAWELLLKGERLFFLMTSLF